MDSVNWSQFKKIHEDIDIAREDKFQYLFQARVAGYPVRDIIDSFLPIGWELWPRNRHSLKSKFGRNDIKIVKKRFGVYYFKKSFYLNHFKSIFMQKNIQKSPQKCILWSKWNFSIN